MAKESSLKIQQFSVDFTLSQWGATPHQKILHSFQNAIKPGMQEALATTLQTFDNNSEQLLFVKKIVIDCVLDLQVDRKKLFNHWANALKIKLALSLRQQQPNQIVVFESPKDYYAQFLRALIAGNAWQQWYFRSFDGLKSLPVSAAIRTLLMDEHQPAIDATAQFSTQEIAQLCTLLSPADCRSVLTMMRTKAGASHASTISQADAQLLQSIFALLDEQQFSSQAQTQLYLAFCTSSSGDEKLLQFPESSIEGIIELKRLVQTLDETNLFSLLQVLQQQDVDRLHNLVGTKQFAAQAWLIAQPATSVHIVIHALEKSSQPPLLPALSIAARFTRFGNVLFLLHQLNNLPLQQWCECIPDCNGAAADAVIKLLSVCSCQGAAKFASALKDPLVQDLCGVYPDNNYPLSVMQVMDWLDAIPMKSITQILQQFQDFFSTAIIVPQSGSDLTEWIINTQQARFTIQGNRNKGLWSNLHYQPRTAPDAQLPILEELNSTSPDMQLAITDLQFLWPPPYRQLPTHSVGLICLLAQYGLRSFACRLPGFAQSSAVYLLNNFLAMTLTLSEKEQHFVAKISRVPMSVMLNMTGITRSTLHLPAFDARPLHLHEVGS